MKVVNDYPPIYDEIDAKFRVRGKPVIFAWGDRIYNPSSVRITPDLMAHEEVHSRQQGDDVEGWWSQYLENPDFRLEAEIPAHLAEYLVRKGKAFNRHERRSAVKIIAKKLSSPLYGGLITTRGAERVLKALEANLTGA